LLSTGGVVLVKDSDAVLLVDEGISESIKGLAPVP